MSARYYLRESGTEWREVTRDEYIAAERATGFISSRGDGPLTEAFSNGAVFGRTVYESSLKLADSQTT